MSLAIFPSSCINTGQYFNNYNQQKYSSYGYNAQCDYIRQNYQQQYSVDHRPQQTYQPLQNYQPQHQAATHVPTNFRLSSQVQPHTTPRPCMMNTRSTKKQCHNYKANNRIKKKVAEPTKKEATNTDKKSFKQKYKTEICHYWQVNGYCRFGDQCAFAHGNLQLKHKTHVPNNYKTQICKQFRQKMYCPYGARCQYLHESQSVLRGELPYSSILRMNFQHLATRLQAQATAQDEDIFKTLMQKGAKFKNFYPRERLPVFKKISELSRACKGQQDVQVGHVQGIQISTSKATISTSSSSSPTHQPSINEILQNNDKLVQQYQQQCITPNGEHIEKGVPRKLSVGSQNTSEHTAADTDDENDEQVERKNKKKNAHSEDSGEKLVMV